jgi:hypothetical protein
MCIRYYEWFSCESRQESEKAEKLEVESEEEVDEDEKGPYILQSEVEKVIK